MLCVAELDVSFWLSDFEVQKPAVTNTDPLWCTFECLLKAASEM
jgi:hypothetical protein